MFIPLLVFVHFVLHHYFPAYGELVTGQDNLLGLDFLLLPSFLSKVLAFLFICGNAFLINYVFNSIEFYERLNFLPSILYILIIFLFPISFYFNEHLVAHTLFTLSFRNLLLIKQNDDARNSAFLSGLFMGLASVFSPIYIIFLLPINIGLFIIRSFSWREHLLPYLGYSFPLLWLPLINPSIFQAESLLHTQFILPESYQFYGGLTLAIISALVLFAHKKILEKRLKSTIRFKRINGIALATFLLALGVSVFLFFWINSYFYLATCIVILPYILTYAFLNLRIKWFAHSLFYLLMIINVIKFFL